MGKPRGHWCSVCGGVKPNEAFSGRGHRDHICKKCQKMPKAKRQEILDRDFIWSVMEQSNISKGNIGNLERIAATYGGELGERGAALVEMAKVKPHKRKRIKWLRETRRPLFLELVRLGLAEEWHDEHGTDDYEADLPGATTE